MSSIIIDGHEVDQATIWPLSPFYERAPRALVWPPVAPAIVQPAAGPTFGEAMDHFYREVVKVHRTPKGIANVDSLLHAHLYPAWGEMPLQYVSKQTIKALLHEVGTTRPVKYRDRTDGRRGRANSIFSVLKSFFRWASDEDNGHPYLEHNPMSSLRQPFPTGERDRILNADELRLFWIATAIEREPFGSIARLLLLTGQRRSEIADMERWQIDRRAQTLTLPIRMTKSQRAHVVPLSDLAVTVLDQVPRRAGVMTMFDLKADRPNSKSRCFWHANELIRKRMLELRRAEIAATGGDPDDAYIPHWVFHDLRRTASTVMCQLGHPLHVVDRILNHGASGTGTGRTLNAVCSVYVRYEYLDERRAALADLGAYVEKLVQ